MTHEQSPTHYQERLDMRIQNHAANKIPQTRTFCLRLQVCMRRPAWNRIEFIGKSLKNRIVVFTARKKVIA